MTTHCPITRSAIETIKRFNIPLAPQRRSVDTFFPQEIYHRTIPPKVHIVRIKERQEVKIRTINELLYLSLEGDIAYQLDEHLELSWTHDGIRLEIELVPQRVSHEGIGEITFKTRLRVIWGRKELVPLCEPFSMRLSSDDELIVPEAVLDKLEELRQ